MLARSRYYSLLGIFSGFNRMIPALKEVHFNQSLLSTFTRGELNFLSSLDERKLLSTQKQSSKTGSFAQQKQFSASQTLVTRKLECVAMLLSKNQKSDALMNINIKLQRILRNYIDRKKREDGSVYRFGQG